jgi:hypothetical protein
MSLGLCSWEIYLALAPSHIPTSLLPGCHGMNFSTLPVTHHHNELNPLQVLVKINHPSFKLLMLDTWSQ